MGSGRRWRVTQSWAGLLCALFLSVTACHPPQPVVVKRSQMLMGTLVFVTAVAPDEARARRAAAAGLDEIRRLEKLWSTWIASSEISRINAAAGSAAVTASPETIELLDRALEMTQLTDGGFNIAVGPVIEAWKINENGRIPPQDELDRLRPLLDVSAITIDRQAGRVFLGRPGMRLDVGGIGKGYAADLAADAMRSAGATAGVVALSGDIKTFGRMPDGHRFVFGIQHPRRSPGEILGRLELEDEAVSTAGDYQRYFTKNGVRYHHIIDPRTLQPARLAQSVTVVARDGIVADGLDTGIFVMGPEKGMAVIERLPHVEGVIVDADGQVRVSSGLRERLELVGDRDPGS